MVASNQNGCLPVQFRTCFLETFSVRRDRHVHPISCSSVKLVSWGVSNIPVGATEWETLTRDSRSTVAVSDSWADITVQPITWIAWSHSGCGNAHLSARMGQATAALLCSDNLPGRPREKGGKFIWGFDFSGTCVKNISSWTYARLTIHRTQTHVGQKTIFAPLVCLVS